MPCLRPHFVIVFCPHLLFKQTRGDFRSIKSESWRALYHSFSKAVRDSRGNDPTGAASPIAASGCVPADVSRDESAVDGAADARVAATGASVARQQRKRTRRKSRASSMSLSSIYAQCVECDPPPAAENIRRRTGAAIPNPPHDAKEANLENHRYTI